MVNTGPGRINDEGNMTNCVNHAIRLNSMIGECDGMDGTLYCERMSEFGNVEVLRSGSLSECDRAKDALNDIIGTPELLAKGQEYAS